MSTCATVSSELLSSNVIKKKTNFNDYRNIQLFDENEHSSAFFLMVGSNHGETELPSVHCRPVSVQTVHCGFRTISLDCASIVSPYVPAQSIVALQRRQRVKHPRFTIPYLWLLILPQFEAATRTSLSGASETMFSHTLHHKNVRLHSLKSQCLNILVTNLLLKSDQSLYSLSTYFWFV